MVTERFALGLAATVVLVVAVLLDEFGSGTALVAVAVLLSGPVAAAPTLTTMEMVALALGPSRPRLQTSGLGAPHEPWLGVAEPKVTLADRGKVSVTTTLGAALGPWLATVMR